jgi:uncharacterized Ntn-hydrolase superfamily protein
VHRFPAHPSVLAARLRLDLLLDRSERAEQRLAALPAELLAALRAERAALSLARGDGAAALQLTNDADGDARLSYLRALAMRSLSDDLEQASPRAMSRRRGSGKSC